MRKAYGLATVLALGLGASTMLAAERATFVLTDGERVSGEVVFHTDARTNIRADKNEFNVKVADGTERPIPFAQVVFIDFIGGQPRDEELAAVPSSGHLMTLRNGENKVGRLVDMVGGTTVVFDELNGGRLNVPITTVRRVYLQPDRIRESFDVAGAVSRVKPAQASTPEQVTGRGRGQNQNSRGGRGSANASSGNITVRGADEWVDAGITVKRGQRITFNATGQVFASRDNSAASNADGVLAPNANAAVPSAKVGALVGKVGDNGQPFLIGANRDAITMPATGRLMLGVNDDNHDDNSGSFNVAISR
jgi:hypothetical protein